MPTRKDVAKLSGYSVATVSYVMNDSKNVTPEVRRKVLDAVEKLQYRPNMVARSLVKNETRQITMLVDNMRNPHYNEILEGAQRVASPKGYLVSVIPVSVSDPKTIVDLSSRGIDGVIIAMKKEPVLQYLGAATPWVTLDDHTNIDFQPAIFEMVETLMKLGHRRIAFLSGLRLSDAYHNRFRHFMQAIRAYHLDLDDDLIVDGRQDYKTDEDTGKSAMEELLRRNVPFTAVFAINDLMAIGAAKALRDAGLRIPTDVSLVGCDNLSILKWYSPSLSTFDVNSSEIGQSLMQAILAKINHKPLEDHLYTAKFIARDSIAPAKRG